MSLPIFSVLERQGKAVSWDLVIHFIYLLGKLQVECDTLYQKVSSIFHTSAPQGSENTAAEGAEGLWASKDKQDCYKRVVLDLIRTLDSLNFSSSVPCLGPTEDEAGQNSRWMVEGLLNATRSWEAISSWFMRKSLFSSGMRLLLDGRCSNGWPCNWTEWFKIRQHNMKKST